MHADTDTKQPPPRFLPICFLALSVAGEAAGKAGSTVATTAVFSPNLLEAHGLQLTLLKDVHNWRNNYHGIRADISEL